MKKKRTKSAKVLKNFESEFNDKIVVEIGEFQYTFDGIGFATCLETAIENHVVEDRVFDENIVVYEDGYDPNVISSAVALCTFGYLNKEELSSMLLSEVLGELDE